MVVNFHGDQGFLSIIIYKVLYIQCLRYNICSAWFLDIRISTCFLLIHFHRTHLHELVYCISSYQVMFFLYIAVTSSQISLHFVLLFTLSMFYKYSNTQSSKYTKLYKYSNVLHIQQCSKSTTSLHINCLVLVLLKITHIARQLVNGGSQTESVEA